MPNELSPGRGQGATGDTNDHDARWRSSRSSIDTTLVQKAKTALVDWPQVKLIHSDGAAISFEAVDSIVASAGATHPLASWLDALRPGGRLLFR